MNASTPTRFYASLTGPLLGLYYPLPLEMTDVQCRVALNSSRLKSLWCSLYPEAEVDRQIEKFRTGSKLPEEFARRLDYDSDAVKQAGAT